MHNFDYVDEITLYTISHEYLTILIGYRHQI
jgi:hypothetical protein